MNNPFCFETRIPKERGKRIDCKYHNPKTINEIEKFKDCQTPNRIIEKLGKIAIVKGGKRLPKGHMFFKTDYDDIPYIRATDIKHGKVDVENSEKINYEVHKKIEKYQLHKGDIVITIVGVNVGEVGILEEDVGLCNFTENIARISIMNEDILNQFVCLFLDSYLGKIQTQRLSVGSIKDKLSLINCRNINVLIPYNTKTENFDINEQYKIINEVSVYNKKAEYNLEDYSKKISELRILVSDKLKIKIPIEPAEEQIAIYGFFNNLKDRIDCYSHSNYYQDIVKKLKENREIDKLIKGKELNILEDRIRKKELEELKAQEFRYVELKHTSELGMIKGYKEDILFNLPTRARQIIKTNDILLPRPIGSTEEIAIVPEEYNNQLCSTGFIIIRPKNYTNALLLWSILKSDLVQKQLFYLQSGSLQPEITPKYFKEKVLIPIPKEEIQKEIIKKTRKKTERAKYFLEEYKTNRQKAEQVFLDMILKS